MFEYFDDLAREAMEWADNLCRHHALDSIGTGHVLLALLSNEGGIAAKVLHRLGITADHVRASLQLPPAPEHPSSLPSIPLSTHALDAVNRSPGELIPGSTVTGTGQLLLALVADAQSSAAQILRCDYGITPDLLRHEIEEQLTSTGP